MDTAKIPTVLIVDDNETSLEMCEASLAGCGLEVLTVSDGRAALDLLKFQHVDLMVTDIFMPHIEGIELLNAARTLQPEARVICMTGGSLSIGTEFLKTLVEKLGATAVLIKPFNADELVAAVGRALGSVVKAP